MIRHTLQAQLYATPQRLTQLESDASGALQGRVDAVRTIVRQQTVRESHLLVESDFTTRVGGEEIMSFVIDRARLRQADAPSYVWLKSVDDVALMVEERSASAPLWIVNLVTLPI